MAKHPLSMELPFGKFIELVNFSSLVLIKPEGIFRSTRMFSFDFPSSMGNLGHPPILRQRHMSSYRWCVYIYKYTHYMCIQLLWFPFIFLMISPFYIPVLLINHGREKLPVIFFNTISSSLVTMAQPGGFMPWSREVAADGGKISSRSGKWM